MFIKKWGWNLLLLATVSVFTFPSCTPDYFDDEQTLFTLSGNADGAQERPNPVTTTGTGTITGNYDNNSNVLSYTITWTGLSGPPNNMHFHGPATTSQAAGVAIGIPLPTTPAAAGTVTGTATLTETQEAELLGGLWYYNIHTAANPGGEIRGQITAR